MDLFVFMEVTVEQPLIALLVRSAKSKVPLTHNAFQFPPIIVSPNMAHVEEWVKQFLSDRAAVLEALA